MYLTDGGFGGFRGVEVLGGAEFQAFYGALEDACLFYGMAFSVTGPRITHSLPL